MNEQGNPNDPHGVITTAEEIARRLFEAERGEEKTKDAPSGSEAVEDEVRALEAVINAELQSRIDADPDMAGFKVHFRAIEVDRLKGADVPLWRVGGCAEGQCSDPECKNHHHSPQLFLLAKRADGIVVILDHEEVIDETEKNQECFGRQGVIQINLGEILGKAVQAAVSKGIEESKEETEKNLEPLDTTVLPLINIAEYRVVRPDNESNARPGLLRRAWVWLRRLWRR